MHTKSAVGCGNVNWGKGESGGKRKPTRREKRKKKEDESELTKLIKHRDTRTESRRSRDGLRLLP